MELNDLRIRQLITCFREDPAEGLSGALEGLKREIGLYIYSFPAMAYRKNRDVCSDFYLFVLERLDKVLASFPMDADVRFKTWFNYVLRNQFHNFSYYQNRNKIPCSSLDGREEEFFVELFEEEELGFEDLKKCLGGIGEWDRTLIKFHYLPETLESAEIRQAAIMAKLPVSEVLEIQRELIQAQHEDTGKKRDLAAKIGRINIRLTEWKHRLADLRSGAPDLQNGAELGELNRLVERIARAETARSRMLRVLKAPDRQVFKLFSRLFANGTAAGRRLDLARNKLRFEMIALKKQNNGVA